jgi:hypothetical protein
MSTLTTIAKSIHERGKAQGWKPGTKTADNLNIECWAGAVAALIAVDHPDAKHVGAIAALVIAPRGYRETIHLATKDEAHVA